jgi:hypothetical protein
MALTKESAARAGEMIKRAQAQLHRVREQVEEAAAHVTPVAPTVARAVASTHTAPTFLLVGPYAALFRAVAQMGARAGADERKRPASIRTQVTRVDR